MALSEKETAKRKPSFLTPKDRRLIREDMIAVLVHREGEFKKWLRKELTKSVKTNSDK